MRALAFLFVTLIGVLQYSLWLGKGGWLKVWDLERQLAIEKQINEERQARNAALDAEVFDLKQGLDAIEERARSELGMIKKDEVFFQVLDPKMSRGVESQTK